jgi:glycogen debranching enzyme
MGVGWLLSTLRREGRAETLGHPVFNNLREGNWLMEYLVSRLEPHPELKAVRDWIQAAFNHVMQLPRYSVPHFFDLVVANVINQAVNSAISRMSRFVNDGSAFIQQLAMVSVQMFTAIPSAPLLRDGAQCAVAAGLPHFSTGYMRSWGRDTMISLRGLYLVTGRFAEAKEILLAFASVERHGLIPNLMDGGVHPRFNCRDAAWWFLNALKEYTLMAPDGAAILQAKVPHRFPSDSQPVAHAEMRSVAEVVQTIMQRHASGIQFIEWNAGEKIDAHMRWPGFTVRHPVADSRSLVDSIRFAAFDLQVSVRLDAESGFIFGGNADNCGTWMDKMGSSAKAGTTRLRRDLQPHSFECTSAAHETYSIMRH